MSDEKEQPKIIKMPLRVRYRRRIQIIIILLLVLLLALAGYLWARKRSETAARTVCSDIALEQAAAFLDRSQTEQLKPIAEDIQGQENFSRDPDCLYIVVTYYVNTYDPANARKYFEELKKVYDAKKGFSSNLGDPVKSLDDLGLDVAFAEKKAEEVENNTMTAPNQE